MSTATASPIESVLVENRVFPPPAEFSRRSRIGSLDVGKDAKLTITKNLDVKVDGDRKDAVKKIYAITADKLQIDVKTELVIKAADSTLTFKGGKVTLKVDKDLTVDAGGAIKIKAGKDLDLQAGGKGNFKASGDLTMKGSKVTQN